MRRRRNRRRRLLQAAAMVLTAAAAAAAVARAARRSADGDRTATDLPTFPTGRFAGAGVDAPPVAGSAPSRSSATASSAGPTR
ncbi:hypothetical protein AB0C04_30385 [Micromonospora sp. NPDC048909]|uniref:hypothetical protein n=1 Tax=Micromonospora sp. NPDC048909 TaxID=3155643 RepID=UPI0033DA9BC2